MPSDTIPFRLRSQARARPDAPAYYVKRNGTWEATTRAAYAAEVRRAARSLLALGLEPGATVAILGFNRPEWLIMDVACMSIGGAPAGIYTTCSAEEVAYIVRHAEAPVVLVENEAQWAKVAAEREHLPGLRKVVLMRGAARVEDPLVASWEDFLALGDGVEDARVDACIDALEPDKLATLIYTSGTTGPPKGVMLSHKNLAWTATAAQELTGTGEDDSVLSYLPLSHIAEQMFSVHGAITSGYAVYFAESIEKVPDNLKEVRPTLFFGVPRIWEKFHAGVAAKLKDAKGFKRALVGWAMRVGKAYHGTRNRGQEPGALLTLQHRVATKLIYAKLKPVLGLDRARMCVSGAAPVAREVLEFMAGLDVPIYEVYGQSEDTGPTSFNRPGRARLGSVGPIVPGVETRIADDGEIQVRGPNVFMGYYKDPETTAETLVDGWLHSGDLGAIDADGFLTITGRKKDIIITSGGKNITPKNIESAVKNHELVSEAVVVGDRRNYLTLLVALDPDAVARFTRERGLEGKTPHELPEVRASIQAALDEVNARLARVETVKKFTILPRPLTIEHGELTPTLKVKRKVVLEHFADAVEAMYRE